MGCYYQFSPCQEACLSFTEEGFQRGIKKRESETNYENNSNMKRVMMSLSFELYEFDWWKMCKTVNIVKRHLRGCFSYEIFLREEILLGNIKCGSLFGYVECDIEVSENLRETFATFPPILKNINVGRDEKSPFKKNYDKKEGILTQARRMLISSYFLEKGAITTPLRFLFLDLGLVYRKH